MKINIFGVYIATGICANVALLFMSGLIIADSYYETKIHVKQRMVLDECMNTLDELKKKNSDSKVEE